MPRDAKNTALSRIYRNQHFRFHSLAKRTDSGDPNIEFEIRSHYRIQFDDAIKVTIFFSENLTRLKNWSLFEKKFNSRDFLVELRFSRIPIQPA